MIGRFLKISLEDPCRLFRGLPYEDWRENRGENKDDLA